MHKKEAYKLFAAAFLLLAVSFISTRFTWIIDLTSDHRYTLSENTKSSLLEIRQPVIIDVLLGAIYLLNTFACEANWKFF